MNPHYFLSDATIAELFCQAWKVGSISTHHHEMLHACLDNPLNSEEEAALKRLSHAIRRGWLEVVD
ncbi:hypothetical protein [Phormidium sp. CCY1219]|jgi:hypothetical protein|uniref:hypothetical protein n=1 Tax=Phormidium sp. CCY1219 TaxID=2886104 RepID=UPI002D1F177A|nr:hypothetical protein [Phormidium sp. CCY1219]MEB3826361.1 hypothetical protein [Phormidium sp. CCY1219]